MLHLIPSEDCGQTLENGFSGKYYLKQEPQDPQEDEIELGGHAVVLVQLPFMWMLRGALGKHNGIKTFHGSMVNKFVDPNLFTANLCKHSS